MISVSMLMAGILLCCFTGAVKANAFTVEEWNQTQENLKTTAKNADHYIGPEGDISTNSWTMILPGETIAVCPEMSYQDNHTWGTLSYNIWQLHGETADTHLLVRSSYSKSSLTPIKTSSLQIEYSLFGPISTIEKDSVQSVEYVSLYQNNTGLPFLMASAHLSSHTEESGGTARLTNSGAAVTAGVIKYSGPTLYFIEPSYQIGADARVEYYNGTQIDWNSLYWQDGTPNLPKSYTMSDNLKTGKDQVFTFPHPKKKGARFLAWFGHSDSGMPHPIGDRIDLNGGEPYYASSPGITRERKDTETTYSFTDMAAFLRSSRVLINLSPDDWVNDITMTALFRQTGNDFTVGLDAQGGTINGYSYYLCEAQINGNDDDISLDLSALKPVLSELKGLNARLQVLNQEQSKKKYDELTQEEKDDKANTQKAIDEQREKKNQIIADYAKGNNIVHQLIDLALLQNGMLKGEALDKFLKRSIDLIQ